MKVHLYAGSLKIVRKSGVGQAIYHQKEMLSRMGIEAVFKDEKDADIVHINTVFPDSLCMACIAKIRHQKVVYYGHSTMEDFRNSFKGSNLIAPIFRRWIIFCYERGDIIITPTEYSREILQSYGIKKPIYSLSNGIDTTFFSPGKEKRSRFREKYHLSENEKVVMSVGHYIGRKGILDFITLSKSMPDTQFFWFGYTDLKLIPKNIQEAIKHAPKNLVFPGYLERDELRDAYCGCDLFAFMSHEETEGIVVLEALACEIPTIVYDIPVYQKWLTDGLNVYKVEDLNHFQTKVVEFLAGELLHLEKEGRKVADLKSLERVGKRLTDIYEDAFCIAEINEVCTKI